MTLMESILSEQQSNRIQPIKYQQKDVSFPYLSPGIKHIVEV